MYSRMHGSIEIVNLLILMKLKPLLLIKKTNYTIVKTQIRNKDIQIVPLVKSLEITIDYRLNFSEHVSNICKSAANQLSALVRLEIFLGSNKKKVIVNSFVLSNFDFCQLVWFVSCSASLRKIENMQKRALRFLLDDYVSSYEQLLKKPSKASIILKNHRALCTEVFKTMIDLNPTYT